jgi:lipopolysaccharide transport system permease protein
MATVVNSFAALDSRRSVIANMAFPRLVLPLASVLTESVAFAASTLLLAGMMVAYGIAPTTAVAWLPLVVAVNLLLAAAVAYPASLVSLWVPDLRPFMLSVVRALFFLAPGLVALDQIARAVGEWVRLNPLTGVFEAYRAVLLDGVAPAPWELVYPLGWAALLAAVFVPIWRREEFHLAKVVE